MEEVPQTAGGIGDAAVRAMKSASKKAAEVVTGTGEILRTTFTKCATDYENKYKAGIEKSMEELGKIQGDFKTLAARFANGGATPRYSMGKPELYGRHYEALHCAYEMYNFLQVFLSSPTMDTANCVKDIPIFAYAHKVANTDWGNKTVDSLRDNASSDFKDLERIVGQFDEETLAFFKTCLACFDPVARSGEVKRNPGLPKLNYEEYTDTFNKPSTEYVKMIDIFEKAPSSDIKTMEFRFITLRDVRPDKSNPNYVVNKIEYNKVSVTENFNTIMKEYVRSLENTIKALLNHYQVLSAITQNQESHFDFTYTMDVGESEVSVSGKTKDEEEGKLQGKDKDVRNTAQQENDTANAEAHDDRIDNTPEAAAAAVVAVLNADN